MIARGIDKDIISVNTINWRDNYGVGNHKQVDDKPYGGGSGMVLQCDPIYNALSEYNAVSPLYKAPQSQENFKKLYPNNFDFWEYKKANPELKNVTISVTPRGFRYNQKIAEWLASDFENINIVCGRYEGFDSRVDGCFDVEISLGDYVLNGGEIAAMAIVESVSRLVPGFVTKDTSVMHDSFSSSHNYYTEQHEYIVGKRRLDSRAARSKLPQTDSSSNLFDNYHWIKNIAPNLEHPQFTRPEIWHNKKIPQVLLEGNHAKIQQWREKWL